jgi:hypothetical protein
MKCLDNKQRHPSRRARYDPWRQDSFQSKKADPPSPTDHTVPYGTDFLMPDFQAFHAWLPSSGPYGTNGRFAAVYAFNRIALYAFIVSVIAFSTGSRSMLEAP